MAAADALICGATTWDARQSGICITCTLQHLCLPCYATSHTGCRMYMRMHCLNTCPCHSQCSAALPKEAGQVFPGARPPHSRGMRRSMLCTEPVPLPWHQPVRHDAAPQQVCWATLRGRLTWGVLGAGRGCWALGTVLPEVQACNTMHAAAMHPCSMLIWLASAPWPWRHHRLCTAASASACWPRGSRYAPMGLITRREVRRC